MGSVNALMDTQPLSTIVASITSGTTTTRDLHGRNPLYGSTGQIGSTNLTEFTGPTILVARVGANAGSVYAVDGSYGITDNALVIRLKAGHSHTFVTEVLKYAELNRMVYGSGQPLVTGTMLKQLDIPALSSRDQARIATVLDDASLQIAALERLIAKKQAIKQRMTQQLLTGRARLPGFTKPWGFWPLPELMSRLNAKRNQVSASSYSDVGRLPVVDQGQKSIVGYTDNLSAGFDPGPDGVLIFGDHTCITKFVDFKFAVGADGTQLMKARERNSTRFFAYALEADPVTSTGYNRHFKFLWEKVLPAPERAEQDAIVATLRDVDHEVEVLKDRLNKARDIKTGMMQQLLSGRTRLLAEAP